MPHAIFQWHDKCLIFSRISHNLGNAIYICTYNVNHSSVSPPGLSSYIRSIPFLHSYINEHATCTCMPYAKPAVVWRCNARYGYFNITCDIALFLIIIYSSRLNIRPLGPKYPKYIVRKLSSASYSSASK